MKPKLLALAVSGLLLLPMVAAAGPYRSFESDLRAAYAPYRAALMQSNSGNSEGTQKAIARLGAAWSALRATWAATPPPQYEEDPDFAPTLDKVSAAIATADKLRTEDLHKTHLALEKIRDEIGALHDRNGVIGFSDYINAYHARMEQTLSTDYAGMGKDALGALREDAAVLAYLADQIARHPAPEAADPAYAPLVAGVQKSVAAIQTAVRAGDEKAALAAVAVLKKPFAKLFLKFG